MTPIRTSKFGFPTAENPEQQQTTRKETFAPISGLHSGRRYTELPGGFTPESQNYVFEDGCIRQRQALTSAVSGGRTGLTNPIQGGMDVLEQNGRAFNIIASDRSAANDVDEQVGWELMAFETDPSATTSDGHWDMAQAWDDDRDNNIVVMTNGRDLPKFVEANAQFSPNTISDYTNAASLVSRANTVVELDNRVVFGGIGEDHPSIVDRGRRVVWSARGNVQNYDNVGIAAGFEDLSDMRGHIQKMVAERESMAIFSDFEIWRATPRRDNFAFDFFLTSQKIGTPFPRTIAHTPGGIIFLGTDLELYLLSGQDVQPIGPAGQGEASRIQRLLRNELDTDKSNRMFGVYRRAFRRYELYYMGPKSSTHPQEAIYLDLESNTFWKQEFSQELSFGFDGHVTKDSIPAIEGSGSLIISPELEEPREFLFDSAVSSYELQDQDFDDNSSGGTDSIDARWRSHGLGPQNRRPRHQFLDGIEVEYAAEESSMLTVSTSDDGFDSSFDTFSTTLQASDDSVAWIPFRMTARDPQFEVRTSDDSTLRISRFHTYTRENGRF